MDSSKVFWEEVFWANVFWIQIGCLAVAAGILIPLFFARFVNYSGLWNKIREWGFSHVRSLHGELCRCFFCEELDELRHRIEELEQRYESLATDLSDSDSPRETDAKNSREEPSGTHLAGLIHDVAFADPERTPNREP